MTLPRTYLADVPTEPGHDAYVSIGLYHDEDIHEAEVSAANGYTHGRGDGIDPFFDVQSVRSVAEPHENAPADVLTLVEVDTSTEMVSLTDVRMFHSKINRHLDVMRHTGMTDIQPGITSPRHGQHENVIPKLVTRVECARGTQEEFRRNLESMTTEWNPGDAVLGVEQDGGTNIGYIIGRGMTLNDASDLDRDTFGPGGKSVTDTYYAGVAVDADEYASFRSAHEAGGGR